MSADNKSSVRMRGVSWAPVLFLLAFLSRRATPRGAYVGIAASAACTVWAVLTSRNIVNLGPYNFRGDDLTIGALGHVVLLAVGYFASLVLTRGRDAGGSMTLWRWLRERRGATHEVTG